VVGASCRPSATPRSSLARWCAAPPSGRADRRTPS
jgi:hypothetical protein